MTLPDWTSAINGQVNTFLSWGTVSGLVAIIVGVAVGAMILSMFMRVFMRG